MIKNAKIAFWHFIIFRNSVTGKQRFPHFMNHPTDGRTVYNYPGFCQKGHSVMTFTIWKTMTQKIILTEFLYLPLLFFTLQLYTNIILLNANSIIIIFTDGVFRALMLSKRRIPPAFLRVGRGRRWPLLLPTPLFPHRRRRLHRLLLRCPLLPALPRSLFAPLPRLPRLPAIPARLPVRLSAVPSVLRVALSWRRAACTLPVGAA